MAKSFTLGDQTINYDWDTDGYNALRFKFFMYVNGNEETKGGIDTVAKLLDETTYGNDFPDKVESMATTLINGIYECFAEEFIEQGNFSFSVKDLTDNPEYKNIMQPITEVISDLRSKLNGVEEYKRLEAQHRRTRKASRGRVIGGGFGWGGFLVGALTAGAINTVTGIGHSVYNTFDEMSTNDKADSKTVSIIDSFDERIYNALYNTCIRLLSFIRRQLNIDIKINANESSSIISNIKKGIIKEHLLFKALTRAITIYPYGEEGYCMFVEKFPEYSDEIKAIADYFGVDIANTLKAIHEIDGIYFQDTADKQFVLDEILSKFNNFQNEYTDSEEIDFHDADYFLKSLNFKFIDEILSTLNSIDIPASKTQLSDYVNSKKIFYTELRKEMELLTIPSYEAVIALSKHYSNDKNAHVYTTFTMPEKVVDLINRANVNLQRKDIYFAAYNYDGQNESVIALSLTHLIAISYLIGVSINTKTWSYDDIQKTDVTVSNKHAEAINVYLKDNSVNNFVLLPPIPYGKEINTILRQILDTQELPEEIKTTIITNHKNAKMVRTKEEVIAEEADLYSRTYNGIVFANIEDTKSSAGESEQIRKLTNETVFSSDLNVLESWKELLKSKDFISPLAKALIQKVELLSKYNQTDLNIFEAVIPDLGEINEFTTNSPDKIIETQELFNSFIEERYPLTIEEIKSNAEIPLVFGKDWVLTTQNLYRSNNDVVPLFNLKHATRMNDLLYYPYLNKEGKEYRAYSKISDSKGTTYKIASIYNKVATLFLISHLPETNGILASTEYYYWNRIFDDMAKYTSNTELHAIYDGRKLPILESDSTPVSKKTRNFAGGIRYIFKYINTSVYDGDTGMALNDEGLEILDASDNKKYFKSWASLATSTIKSNEGWFSNSLDINGSSYPMGSSEAKVNEWSDYINGMVSIYKNKMSYYESYVFMVNNLSNTPEDFKTFYTIDGINNPYPTPSTPNNTLLETQVTTQEQKAIRPPIPMYERINTLISAFDNEFWNRVQSCFPITTLIPQKKASNVVKSYAKDTGIQESDILILFDATLFGSAKDGFIITDKFIVGSEDKTAIPLENVSYISLMPQPNNKYTYNVTLEPMHQVITSFAKMSELEALIEKINLIIFNNQP